MFNFTAIFDVVNIENATTELSRRTAGRNAKGTLGPNRYAAAGAAELRSNPHPSARLANDQ